MIETSSKVGVVQQQPHGNSEPNLMVAAKGGGITFIGTIFAYVARFGISILLARFLGARQYGLYNLALTAAAVAAALADLGMNQALVRYIPLFSSRRDEDSVWGTLQLGIVVPLAVGLLFSVGLVMLANPIAVQLFHEPSLAPLLRLASLIVPFQVFVYSTFSAMFGFKKMEYAILAEKTAFPLIRLGLVLALAVVGIGVTSALLIFIVATVATAILSLYYLNQVFPLRRPLKSAQRKVKELFMFSLPIYLTQLIETFRGNLETVLLGTFSTVATVGIFAIASQVNMAGMVFYQSISLSARPLISELYDRQDWPELERIYQTMTKWTLTANLPLFLMVLLFADPILTVFGGRFVEGAVVLSIMAWRNLIEAGTGICGVVIDMTGQMRLKTFNSIVVTALLLGLNLLLIPRWGIIGAAVTPLVGSGVVNVLRMVEVYILFKIHPYNRSFLKPITAGVVTFIVTFLVRELMHTEAHLLYAGFNIALLMGVYVLMILLLGLSEEDQEIVRRVRARLGARFVRA